MKLFYRFLKSLARKFRPANTARGTHVVSCTFSPSSHHICLKLLRNKTYPITHRSVQHKKWNRLIYTLGAMPYLYQLVFRYFTFTTLLFRFLYRSYSKRRREWIALHSTILFISSFFSFNNLIFSTCLILIRVSKS